MTEIEILRAALTRAHAALHEIEAMANDRWGRRGGYSPIAPEDADEIARLANDGLKGAP